MEKRKLLKFASLLFCMSLLVACNKDSTTQQGTGEEEKEAYHAEAEDEYAITGLDEELLGLEKLDGSDEQSRDFENRDVELKHEDIRREAENYINQVKALGIEIGGGFGDLSSYVQLIATVAQIEHNNRLQREVEEK